MTSAYYNKFTKTPDLQTGEFFIKPTDLVRDCKAICDIFINISPSEETPFKDCFLRLLFKIYNILLLL